MCNNAERYIGHIPYINQHIYFTELSYACTFKSIKKLLHNIDPAKTEPWLEDLVHGAIKFQIILVHLQFDGLADFIITNYQCIKF